MIGWWSEKMAELGRPSKFYGTIYRTPEGEEVLVSMVTPGELQESRWDDLVCVGPVTEIVRLAVDGDDRRYRHGPMSEQSLRVILGRDGSLIFKNPLGETVRVIPPEKQP